MSLGVSQFFKDDKQNYSAMRLYCFLALCQAIALSWYGLLTSDTTVFSHMTLFITAAFAPKAIQKFAETMGNSSENNKPKDPKLVRMV